MPILGLVTTSDLDSFKSLNERRRVFFEFPNGAAPLTGLLSLMDSEVTDNPEFGWWEQRFRERTTTTAQWAATKGPFSHDGTNASDGTSHASGLSLTAGTTQIWVKVADTTMFKPTHQVLLRAAVKHGGTDTQDALFVVTQVVSSTVLKLRALSTLVLKVSDTSNNGKDVIVAGTVNPEGGTSTVVAGRNPTRIANYTQIFRNAFTFTRTALKEPLKFDKSGFYKTRAKETALDHMIEMENAFLFGVRQSYTVTTADGETVPERATGGVLWFLEQWEKQKIATLGSAFDYNTDATAAATLDSDSNKRIIENTTGSMTRKTFEDYVARVFENTNNKSFEKLVLCGSGALAAINAVYEKYIQTTKGMGPEETYGMNLTGLETIHGKLWFKTHPLFNKRPWMKNHMLFLDVPNLVYRHLTDSDTTLLKNRQGNDADRRKDEWLTEAGLEVRYPESHMLIKNVQTITL